MKDQHEKRDKISNSLWKCDKQQVLITLHEQYILLECEYLTTIAIFYTDIISLKKNIQEVDVDGVGCGGRYSFHEIIIKTLAETFRLTHYNEPYLMESPDEFFNEGEELFSQILDKIAENK